VNVGAKVYNQVVTLGFSGTVTLDANGGYVENVGGGGDAWQIYLTGYPGANFDPSCNSYSSYSAAVTYYDNPSYVLLENGSQVCEYLNAGTIDPNSGVFPNGSSACSGTTATPTNSPTNSPTLTPTNSPTWVLGMPVIPARAGRKASPLTRR